jgi:hypothetical protein
MNMTLNLTVLCNANIVAFIICLSGAARITVGILRYPFCITTPL